MLPKLSPSLLKTTYQESPFHPMIPTWAFLHSFLRAFRTLNKPNVEAWLYLTNAVMDSVLHQTFLIGLCLFHCPQSYWEIFCKSSLRKQMELIL